MAAAASASAAAAFSAAAFLAAAFSAAAFFSAAAAALASFSCFTVVPKTAAASGVDALTSEPLKFLGLGYSREESREIPLERVTMQATAKKRDVLIIL